MLNETEEITQVLSTALSVLQGKSPSDEHLKKLCGDALRRK